MPELITSYEQFLNKTRTLSGPVSLFWIIEYSPDELGCLDENDPEYISSPFRYSLMRNECLNHPNDYSQRLNNHLYRIWITTPYNYPWE